MSTRHVCSNLNFLERDGRGIAGNFSDLAPSTAFHDVDDIFVFVLDAIVTGNDGAVP